MPMPTSAVVALTVHICTVTYARFAMAMKPLRAIYELGIDAFDVRQDEFAWNRHTDRQALEHATQDPDTNVMQSRAVQVDVQPQASGLEVSPPSNVQFVRRTLREMARERPG